MEGSLIFLSRDLENNVEITKLELIAALHYVNEDIAHSSAHEPQKFIRPLQGREVECQATKEPQTGPWISDAYALDMIEPSQRKSLGFLSETSGLSRRFRKMDVNYVCCQEKLCLTAVIFICGARVVQGWDALVRVCNRPARIVNDDGSVHSAREPAMAKQQ